jgi:phospholipase/carboxylesterase
MAADAFVHRFVPATDPSEKRTLLMLHGTGGTEEDLLPLGAAILPGAAMLSPRGRILENGMPRFFRRFAEGVFDLDSLRAESEALGDFVSDSAQRYGFDPASVVAVGFSNGANIAGGLLLLRPEVLAGAIMLRPMVTLEPDPLPDLTGKRVLLVNGKQDPIVPVDNAQRLGEMLQQAGAAVQHLWLDTGHNLTRQEINAAMDWLAKFS